MYLSHPVRRMREDPMAGEDVTLVVELGDRSAEELTATVESLGGEVEAELPFDSYRARLPQEAVDEFCELDGLAAVETANAVGYGGDAGEDVES
ncbi:hypothetical protein [Halorarum salinum]|uniref:Putative peptidase inhibitor domain-containing protein n=1 Tax=Halorarum salinum TaxID=2743089 RepID=A0A7D5QIF6_9EURY|nr:hypothetical protein [Halobaculum salinum]QLG63362.1 hypothetical protein HUG12_17130 [Halobaculum salinum]